MTEALFDVPEPKHCATGCWYCQTPDPATSGAADALQAAQEWADKAQAWLAALDDGRSFTSEDLTNAVGKPAGRTETNANNAVGAFIRAQKQRGYIQWIGYVQALNRESHGAVLRLWRKVGDGDRW